MTVEIDRATALNIAAALTEALSDPDRQDFSIGFTTQDWRPSLSLTGKGHDG